jgi:sRNA-binding protein
MSVKQGLYENGVLDSEFCQLSKEDLSEKFKRQEEEKEKEKVKRQEEEKEKARQQPYIQKIDDLLSQQESHHVRDVRTENTLREASKLTVSEIQKLSEKKLSDDLTTLEFVKDMKYRNGVYSGTVDDN